MVSDLSGGLIEPCGPLNDCQELSRFKGRLSKDDIIGGQCARSHTILSQDCSDNHVLKQFWDSVRRPWVRILLTYVLPQQSPQPRSPVILHTNSGVPGEGILPTVFVRLRIDHDLHACLKRLMVQMLGQSGSLDP